MFSKILLGSPRAHRKVPFVTMLLTNGIILIVATMMCIILLQSSSYLIPNVGATAAAVAKVQISNFVYSSDTFQKSVRNNSTLVFSSSDNNRRNHALLYVMLLPMKPKHHQHIIVRMQPLYTNIIKFTNSCRQKTLFMEHIQCGSFLSTLSLRGGGTTTDSSSIISATVTATNPIVKLFLQFIQFIGKSKTRCLCLLVCSILLENFCTTLSKRSKDIGSPKLFACACCLYIICMLGFNIALAKIDVSVAYAIWSALGTVVVTAAGILFFGESLTFMKFLCLCLISIGVIGINMI